MSILWLVLAGFVLLHAPTLIRPAFADSPTEISCSTQLCTRTLAEARFRTAIEALSQSLDKAVQAKPNFSELSDLSKVEAISAAGMRANSFPLQSLGRMYRNSSNHKLAAFANRVRTITGRSEGLVARYELLVSLGKTHLLAEAAHDAVQALEADGLLSHSGAGERLKDWLIDLSKIDWQKEKKDRRFAIEEMVGQLKNLRDTKYDMKRLETGVHELRRELRWFAMYAQASDGLIAKSSAEPFACIQSEIYFKQYVDSKYAALKSNSSVTNTCTVSECLYDEIVGAVGALGKLKDKVEPLVEKDPAIAKLDQVPKQFVEKAKEHYKNLRRSKVVERLIAQLKNCL